MTLAELGKLVTALKTSATHLGVKHEDMEVTFNADNEDIYQFNLRGATPTGSVSLVVHVD